MKTKNAVQILTLTLLCVSIVSIAYGERVTRDRTPISYHITQEEYDPIKTLAEAKNIVETTWDLPDKELSIISSIKSEEQMDETYWSLSYYDGEEYLLRVKMETETGRIVSLTDHRYEGTDNNVKDEKQVLAIASRLYEKMGVDVSKLPEPNIHPPHKAGDVVFNEYTVIHPQYYNGLPVLGGYLRTRIDAESLQPVGYTNALIDVDEINVTPKTTKESATKAAGEYLKSTLIQEKGYGYCEILSIELCIGRIHYHPYEDGVIVPCGEPQLMWYVTAQGENSRPIGIMIDASNDTIIGIEEVG